MPVITTNPNTISGIQSIAKAFIGDPQKDLEYEKLRLENKTEALKQDQLSQGLITEAIKQKVEQARINEINANLAASKSLADQRNQEVQGRQEAADLFKKDYRNFDTPGGMSQPGDMPAGTPGAGLNIDQIAPALIASMLKAKATANDANILNLLPGNTDAQKARVMLAGGKALGKDDYVSIDDRNNNRRFDVAAGNRLTDNNGKEVVPIAAQFLSSLEALTNQRNASAENQLAQAQNGGGSRGAKVPKLGADELNSIITSVVNNHGGDIGSGNYKFPAEFMARQPELYNAIVDAAGRAWQQSGGNAATVQNVIGQLLKGVDLSNFNGGMFSDPQAVDMKQLPSIVDILQGLQNPQVGGNIPNTPPAIQGAPNIPAAAAPTAVPQGFRIVGVSKGK